jgi:hypothetical protein
VGRKTKTPSKPKYDGPPVFVDPRDFAATAEESRAFHEQMASLYVRRNGPDLSMSRDLPWTSLCRRDVDRAYRVSLLLGFWSPVSSLWLCREILRLHDVLAVISLSLELGRPDSALTLARPECGPEWAAPLGSGLDMTADPGHTDGQEQAEDGTADACDPLALAVPVLVDMDIDGDQRNAG